MVKITLSDQNAIVFLCSDEKPDKFNVSCIMLLHKISFFFFLIIACVFRKLKNSIF